MLFDIRECVPWLCSVKVNWIRLEQKSTELSICLWQQGRGSEYNDTSFDHCPKSQEHAAHALPEPESQVSVEFKGLQWIILLWTCPAAFWIHLKSRICGLLQWEAPQLSYVMCEMCLPVFACFEPFNYCFHLMIPNACIRIDHKESFPTYCLCAAFHLLCLSILLFRFLFCKVLMSLAGSHLEAVSHLWWLLLPSPGLFFISTLFFSKQKAQTVPGFQDAGKPWIYSVA